MDVLLKPDSESLRDSSQLQMSLCEESFPKKTPEEAQPQKEIKGLYNQNRIFLSFACPSGWSL